MPKRKTTRLDKVTLPLVYDYNSTGTSLTTVETLRTTVDKHRAFRVSAVRMDIVAVKHPIMVQFEVYGGPEAATDNKWSTPILLVPLGTTTRYRCRLPVSRSGWYPSGTSDATRICQLVNICSNPVTIGGVKAVVYLTIELGPFEPSDSCPAVQAFVPCDQVATTSSLLMSE